jgi:hypothetical protein
VNGHENLIPFDKRTQEEQREIAKKGGVASGKARRKKADFKRAANLILSGNPTPATADVLRQMGFTDDEIDNTLAIVFALTSKAQRGDVDAARALFKFSGNDPEDKRKDEELKLRREDLKLRKAQAEQKTSTAADVEDLKPLAEMLNEPDD